MRQILKKVASKLGYNPNQVPPQGEIGIKKMGHREYVGGLWEEIGQLQFDFLIDNGLQKTSIFLDIACGSLRAGRLLIPYLEEGHYLGIDKEKKLVELGIENELDEAVFQEKKPELIISDTFEFHKFSKIADFAIAQSLFTHLPHDLIHDCFKKLSMSFKKDGVFFATYFISADKTVNPLEPHDHECFYYSREQVIEFGRSNGWNGHFIGDWNHPRGQQIVKYSRI